MKAYIARDKDGSIWGFREKPFKNDCDGEWLAVGGSIQLAQKELPEGINPQWEDENPIELELTITKVNST